MDNLKSQNTITSLGFEGLIFSILEGVSVAEGPGCLNLVWQYRSIFHPLRKLHPGTLSFFDKAGGRKDLGRVPGIWNPL